MKLNVNRTAVAAAAVLAACTLGAVTAHSAANRALPDPTIATISIAEVINGLEEIQQRQNELRGFISERDAKIRKIEQEFESTKSEFDILPDGAEKRNLAEQLERLRVQRELEEKLAGVLVDRRRGEIFAELFDKIDASVRELAEGRGYTLVLTNDDESGMPSAPTEQQARAAIYGRRVMYADDAVDITDELVEKMNNQWRVGQNP